MEKSTLIKISAAGLFAATALGVASVVSAPEAEARPTAIAIKNTYRFMDTVNWTCPGSGNCLPTIVVSPK